MAFSDYMKNLRLEGNESQVGMAKILDISVTAIKLIETGATKFPSEKVLQKLCEYTNSDPIEVMMHILFREKEIELRCCLCKYLAYMYLQGWNIVTDLDDKKTHHPKISTYDAKIVKKRENKNVVYTVRIERYLRPFSMMSSMLKNENFDLVTFIAMKAMRIQEPFRGLHILFDCSVEKEKELFESLSSNEYKHIDFYVDAILFDSNKGEIVDSKRVKN